MKLFPDLEFHRTGIGLVADPHEPDRGSPVYLANVAGSQRPLTFCSCAAGRRTTCDCLHALEAQIGEYQEVVKGRVFTDLFFPSRWHRLAQLLFEGHPAAFEAATVVQEGAEEPIRFLSEEGVEVVRYLELSPSTVRLLERTGKAPKAGGYVDRSGLIERLSTFLRTPEEQHLNKAGLKTNRQSFEDSIWCRLAYHCFREHGEEGTMVPLVELRTGELFVQFVVDKVPVVQVQVPRPQVNDVLVFLEQEFPDLGLTPRPLSLSALVLADPGTRLVLPPGRGGKKAKPTQKAEKKAREGLALVQAHGREAFTDEEETARFRYGDLVFLETLCVLARDDHEDDDEPPEALDLASATIEAFETTAPDASKLGQLVLDDPMAGVGISRRVRLHRVGSRRDH